MKKRANERVGPGQNCANSHRPSGCVVRLLLIKLGAKIENLRGSQFKSETGNDAVRFEVSQTIFTNIRNIEPTTSLDHAKPMLLSDLACSGDDLLFAELFGEF